MNRYITSISGYVDRTKSFISITDEMVLEESPRNWTA